MKKILVLSLVLILVLSAIPMASAEPYVVTTKVTTLNERVAPQQKILPGGLDKGSIVEIIYTIEYRGAIWGAHERDGEIVFSLAEYGDLKYLTKLSEYEAANANPSATTENKKKPGSDIEVLAGLDPSKEYEGELYVVNLEKGTLNVRRGPGKSHKISVRLLPGSYVEVIATEGKWAKIHYKPGKVGWVMLEYITPAVSQ